MGFFSWLDCETKEQIKIGDGRSVYVLIPAEFGGGHICETHYEGYGEFGLNDIYELVAIWNKKYLSDDSNAVIRDFKSGLSKSKMREKYGDDYLRKIGIDIACEDEDNENLKYPIKITHNANAVYEECSFSLSDPNQGCD